MIHSIFTDNLGLWLLLFGVVFMVAEAFVFSFGILGFVGFLGIMFGVILLLEAGGFGLKVALPVVIFIGLVLAAFLAIIIIMALKARRKTIVSGRESLIGSRGTVQLDSAGIARIKHRGEWWQVIADEPLEQGAQVEIVTIAENMRLKVKSVTEEKKNG